MYLGQQYLCVSCFFIFASVIFIDIPFKYKGKDGYYALKLRLTLFKLYIPYEYDANLIIYKSPNQQCHEWCCTPK